MMAEATADDDETPQGQQGGGEENRFQGGFLGIRKNSARDHKEIATNNKRGDSFGS